MSPRLREEKRFREQRLLGIKTGIPTYVPPELTLKGFKILVYDVSQTKVGELGADIQFGKVSEIEWELMDFGCGSFSFILDSLPSFPIIYRTRIDICPYFSPSPWFSGFVQTIPKPGQKPPYRYIGFGFFEQLDWVTVTASYQSQEVSVIIKNIVQNTVAPNTQIAYNASKIETTAYTVTDINFDHALAKDALQQLAAIAQGYEFGVDNSREFYFRAVDTTVYYHHWAGRQFQDVEIEEDPLSVRNKLYVKSGKIQADGTNIVGNVLNQNSIDTYGLREDIVTAPDVLNTADALQWAGQILAEKKDPQTKARIRNVLFDTTKTKIDSKGRIKITTFDGAAYTLQVKRVLYRISSAGTLGEIEGGAVLIPFEEHFVNQMKQAGEEQRLGDKRTKELDGGIDDLWTEMSIKPSLLDTATSILTIENTTAESTLYSLSIGLSMNDALRVLVRGKFKNNRGGTSSITIRIKLGSTTLYADTTVAFPDSAVEIPYLIEFTLNNLNSQSSQALVGRISFASVNAATTGLGDLGTWSMLVDSPIYGGSSENLAAAKTLAVTVQLSFASAALYIKRYFASVEKLPTV